MSDTIDDVNIGTGLDLIGRKREGREAPFACCPRCPDLTPLISTCVFRGAEFYCLECGARVGFLSPKPGEPTPELRARYEALQAEWDEHAAGLAVDGREPSDRDADERARLWLADRIGGTGA